MNLRKYKLFLFATILVIVGGCGGNNAVKVNEADTKTGLIQEVIRLNNCGGKANAEQVAERSQSVSFDGGGQLGIKAEVLSAVISAKYGQVNTTKKSQKLVAPPETNMEFTLEWSQQILIGTITDGSDQVGYEVQVPISVNLVLSRDIGCDPSVATNSQSSIRAGEVILEEDFSSNQTDWWTGEKSDDRVDRTAKIVDGKYRVSLTSKDGTLSAYCIPNLSLENFLVSFEATLVDSSTSDAEVAFEFRRTENPAKFYLVDFYPSNTSGIYSVELYADGEYQTISNLKSANGSFGLTKKSTEIFTIAVQGSTFTVYANGKKLTTVTDPTLKGKGEICLGAGLFEGGQKLTIDFDNIRVETLSAPDSMEEAAIVAQATAQTRGAATAEAQGILFEDNFSSNKNDWIVGEFSDSWGTMTSESVGGKYRMSITSKESVTWWRCVPSLDFSVKDFWLDVDATLIDSTALSGDANISIIFRKNEDGDHYRVDFENDGGFAVLLYKNDEWDILKTWTSGDNTFNLDKEVDVSNKFSVLVEGSAFTIYANDNKLATITDSTLREAGNICLGIELDEANQQLTVDFDNLLIRKP